MEEFLFLLKRYSDQCRKCFAYEVEQRGVSFPPGWIDLADHHPYPIHENLYVPLSELRREISSRLDTLEFRAPYGWPETVGQAFALLRSGRLDYHVSHFFDVPVVKPGMTRDWEEREFNPNRAGAMLAELDQRIGEIEAALCTVGKPTADVQRNSDREIVETLRAVGHRLSTEKLLDAMDKRRLNPSPSTVKKRLAAMVKDERLTKDPKSRPRGYGLPEWGRGSSGS
jgi:hypothetical protein